MTQGVTYITPMCILYCILHIRMPLRCAVVAAVSGYGGVFYASGGSGLAKTRLKRFMILTPVLIMRILFRRSLDCIKILVKKRGFCSTFTCPCNIVLHAFGFSLKKCDFASAKCTFFRRPCRTFLPL